MSRSIVQNPGPEEGHRCTLERVDEDEHNIVDLYNAAHHYDHSPMPFFHHKTKEHECDA